MKVLTRQEHKFITAALDRERRALFSARQDLRIRRVEVAEPAIDAGIAVLDQLIIDLAEYDVQFVTPPEPA